MGCIPSVPVHGGIHDEDYLTMPSLDDTSDTCPYHRSAQSASSPQGGNSLNAKAQQYTDRPTFLMQLFQTILIFVGLYYVCIGVFKVIPLHFLFKSIMNVTSDIPKSIVTLWTSTKALFKAIDSSWILRKPANWWETNEVDWDQPLFVEVQLAKVALAAMVLDLLFSSEKKQGNPILLTPTLLYSVFYFIISVHAQATKLLDPAIYQSFNATKIGLAIFSQPEIVALTFTHLFALDLALAFAMMKDFYCRISSRRLIYRFLMIGIVLGTIAQGITMLPFYLFLKWTIFASPLIHSPRPLPTNRNSHDREFNYLLDPIPRGSGAINGWIQSIPSPMNIPFMLFYVALGVARFVIVLATYFLYVTFICIPVSAVFFCLRRSWRLLLGKEVQGALYTPLATLHGTNFPPKAILIVSAHIRLICFKHRSSFLFNILIGWWLRKCMEAYVMYEFTLPFKNDFSPYIAFLMEEFGPVFPMGEGLGFGGYKDVKAIIENPDQRKSGISLAWSISCAQFAWSKNNLTTLPQTEIEKSIVIEGRELVRCWLKDVSTNLQSTLVRKQLDAILPYANIDGSMIDKKLIEISFGSTLFHLLTDGELTELERKRYYKLLTNAFPFMSDWINKVWFGGILEFKGIQDYDLIRRAFLRYLEAPSLQRTLAMAEENNWDAWSAPEVVRFLVYMFVIAGGAAPAFILGNIVQKLYDEPNLVAKYKENPRKFILEMSRLERGVPLVNFISYNFISTAGNKYVTIFNNQIPVPDGTSLHCSVQNANRDVSVFGIDAGVLNFDRDPTLLANMMTFNGNLNEIAHAEQNKDYDCPPRRCPGYSYAMDIIEFLVERYCPEVQMKDIDISDYRLSEIKRKETIFMKFVLKMGQITYSQNNKYFPHASEVKHPLDTNGRNLGSLKVTAAGDRSIPIYDEDVPIGDMLKDEMTSAVLKIAPITDDEGEWLSATEAIAWRMKWFNSNFPPVNTNYSSFLWLSPKVSQLAFGGLCCLHTRKVTSLPKSSVAREKCQDKSAVYVNDNTSLGSYRVRRGYQRYGAAAFFDRNFHLIGVYTCCDGEYHERPAKLAAVIEEHIMDQTLENEEFAEWRHAMWAWRVSALALVTVADHLVNVHMIAANALVSASSTYLSINHPLRAFLKIFTYRTIGINNKACRTLIMRKGVVSRNWAFEEDDLQELLFATKCNFKKNFRDHIPDCMKDVPEYPANKDLVMYCDAVTELVRDFLSIVYDSPGVSAIERRQLQRNMDNDPELQLFLEGLAGQLGLVKNQDLTAFCDVVDVLTSLICSVTGMHEQVGQISDYFADPSFCGTTIRRGKEIDSIQIYQLNCTLVSSTGLRMPRLMGNWDHLLVRNRFADETTQVMQCFQEKLRKISLEVDQRNDNRRFKMESFNPVHLECSVSV